MKRGKLILIIILCAVFIGIGLLVSIYMLAKPKIRRNLSYWQNNDYSEFYYGGRLLESFLPKYNDELKYSNAEFYYHNGCINFDYAEEAYCLELDFSETEYNQAKESVQQNYNFLAEISLEYENLSLDNFKIGEYNVHLVDIKDPKFTRFPHEIQIIAFNESINRVRYCYIVDMRLDYLEDEADFQWWIKNNLKINW